MSTNRITQQPPQTERYAHRAEQSTERRPSGPRSTNEGANPPHQRPPNRPRTLQGAFDPFALYPDLRKASKMQQRASWRAYFTLLAALAVNTGLIVFTALAA